MDLILHGRGDWWRGACAPAERDERTGSVPGSGTPGQDALKETTGGLTPEQVLAQEAAVWLPSLSDDDAVGLGLLALSRARSRGLPVTLEVRRGARVAFRAALPGSTADQDSWIARKARVVERFGHSTLYERVRCEADGTTFPERTGLPESRYAAHGGGVPLVVAGTGMVGVLLVSGLPQVEDHTFAVEVLRAWLAGDRA